MFSFGEGLLAESALHLHYYIAKGLAVEVVSLHNSLDSSRRECGLNEGKRCLERDLYEVDVLRSWWLQGVRILFGDIFRGRVISHFPA